MTCITSGPKRVFNNHHRSLHLCARNSLAKATAIRSVTFLQCDYKMCLDSDRGRKMMLLDEDLDRTPQLYQLYAGGESRQAAMGRPGEIEGTSTYRPSAPASSPDLSFPWRLSTMLTDSEKSPGGFQHIVSWINDGMAFKVHNRPEFTKKILPAYFKMTKYSSFTRQLHAYSFACARKGESRGGCKPIDRYNDAISI